MKRSRSLGVDATSVHYVPHCLNHGMCFMPIEWASPWTIGRSTTCGSTACFKPSPLWGWMQHSLSVITAALKTLGSISSRRIRASLCLPAGLDAEGISALLQFPVQAAGELYILELACEGMDEPIAGRDEHLYQLTLGYAEGLLRAQNAGQGFLDQIKHHMDGEQLVQTDIDTVAAAVGVTRRTLQRHLDDQGTSFRKLKEGLLKERALELLVARNLPIAHIAEALGYADVSTFHRAFKAWFGVTPRQFKSQIGS